MDIRYIFCGICLLCALWFLIRMIRLIMILRSGVECRAVIEKYEEFRTRKGPTLYRPLLKYTDMNGREHLVSASAGYRDQNIKHRPGEEVTIHYDRRNPKKIVLSKGELFLELINFSIVFLFGLWLLFSILTAK